MALGRYLSPDDPPRVIVPLALDLARVVDLRGTNAQAEASVVWQDLRDAGTPSPTWALSDRIRRLGASAMLYASRSRPDLSHIVLFDLRAGVVPAGPPRPWHPTVSPA